MECREARARINEELDGTLTGVARRRLLRHLERCSGCAEALRVLRRALEALRESDRGDLPALPAEIERFLHRGEASRSTAAHEVFDLEGLAEFLRVGVADLEPYLDDLPAFEIAGQRRFRRAAVERWMEEQEFAYRARRRASRMRINAG